jgi:SAM-dependent methyltransferase
LAPLSSSRRRWRFGFITGCARCGVLFANPLPTAAELDAVYSPEGQWGQRRQDEHEKQVSHRRLQAIFAPVSRDLDVLHPPAGASVLDFGCGLGGMLDALASVGWATYGIDPAMSNAFARHKELTSIPETPRFDLVVLHHVLEHVITPLDILQELARATRVGGYLLISVPNLDDLAHHGELKYCLRSTVHVLAYTARCLTSLTAQAGFRVVSSARSPGAIRQRVVLARREDGILPRPVRPLSAARAMLEAYYARYPQAAAPLPRLPVRTRAAYCDLQRAEWRLGGANIDTE